MEIFLWVDLKHPNNKKYDAVNFLLFQAKILFAVLPCKNMIYIYQDQGVSQESFTQITLILKEVLPETTLEPLNAVEVCQGLWAKDADLLIIPGGADVPYTRKLNGLGNQQIKDYVSHGGAFLGICAGAYYACAEVIFDKGGPLEVIGTRQLAFFPGKAMGPILAPYDYKTQRGSRAASLRTVFPNVPTLATYYNGGPFFQDAQQYPGTRVLARYNDNHLPAVLEIHFGKGTVVLSGVHPEHDPFTLDPQDPYLQKILPTLKQSDTDRKDFFRQLLQILGIKYYHSSHH